jgi:hypothetical protein
MNRRSCIELENNKSLNPLTLRRIDPTKGVFKKLANECLDLGINVRSRRARSRSRERRSPPRMQSRSTREQPQQVMESSKKTSPDRKLARYQRKVVEFMKKPANNAILMVHSIGSRKTFTTINAVFELQKQRPNVHVLIIAPKRNLDKWQLECLRFKIKNVDYISFAYLVNNPNDFFRLCQDGIVVIDEVHNLRTENERFHYSKTKIVKFLKAKKFSDEMIGHLFANFDVEELILKTQIPKELVFTPSEGESAYFGGSCATFSWKMFLLTSSPIVTSHTDLNNIIRMLSRGTVAELGKETTLENIDKTLSQLPISYFDVEKTKGAGFPDYVFEDVLVELTPKQRMKYIQNYEGPNVEEQWLKGVPLIGILTNILSGSGNVELGAYYSPKLNFVKDILLEKKTKSVVHSKWLGSGMDQALAFFKRAIPELADLRGRILGITEKTSITERTKIINEYNRDDSFKILIIAGIPPREILNLKGTRNMFLLEPGWDETIENETLSVAVRYQSHSHLPFKYQKCHFYRLLNGGMIDVALQQMYTAKKETTNAFTDLLKKYSI